MQKTKELRDVMGINKDYINVPITKTLRASLMRAFKGTPHTRSSRTERWFTVWDEKANNALTKIIPLSTEGMPCYYVDSGAFLLWFDWNTQKFIVSA